MIEFYDPLSINIMIVKYLSEINDILTYISRTSSFDSTTFTTYS